jgi:hypothetical protein
MRQAPKGQGEEPAAGRSLRKLTRKIQIAGQYHPARERRQSQSLLIESKQTIIEIYELEIKV